MWFSFIVLSLISIALWFYFREQPFPESAVIGKRVLITGASQGIGRSLVEEYARRGAGQIVIASRNKNKLEAVRREVLSIYSSITIHVVPVDLSSEDACKYLINASLEFLGGGLDILVLNHITSSRFGTWLGDVANSPEGHIFLAEMFAVNTLSYIWLTTYAMNAISSSGGSIGVVSSLAGLAANPKVAAYSATKHALHGFFDALRIEIHGLHHMHNVSITLSCIGATDTEGAQEVRSQLSPSIQWFPAGEAARAIVRAIAERRRHTFYPLHLVYPSYILKTMLPDLFDYILLQTVKTI